MPPAILPESIRLAVDIGGTFTDIVLETPGGSYSAKVLTTKAAPEDGARAATLSHEILQKLRQGDDTAATWTVELQRGWTELGRMWATLRRGGAFVFHGRLDAKLPLLGLSMGYRF